MDVNLLRKRVGMVFQKPNPFPMSIYDNIAFGPRTHGIHSKSKLDDIVEKSLRDAAIWEECKDRLKKSALGMSGGQQQRLCTVSYTHLDVYKRQGLSKADLRLARNEILARHGRIFNSDDLKTYFEGKSWYSGTVAPEDVYKRQVLTR